MKKKYFECNGSGWCFENYGPTDECGNQLLWRKKKGTKCPCKLQKCDWCGAKVPTLVLECFDNKYCGYNCVFESQGQYGIG
jgi:hypothetical protein